MKKSFKYTVNQGLPGGPNELKKFIQGSISVTGYKSDSPDVNNDFNIIPSNQITMQGVNFPVLGIDNLGNEQMMMPGGEYTFPGDYVTELPQMGKGGLTQWFAEEWTDVKTGKKCGRSGKEKGSRPYPACRPKKRVNETTPKTTSEMSSAEKEKFKRSKTSGKRINYNHKRQQEGGQWYTTQEWDDAIPDSTAENILEFFDPTGYTSHDDARRAYREWKKSGSNFPSFQQGMDMFGAVPVLGKFGKIKYLADPKAMKAVYKFLPWQQIINAADTVQDEIEKQKYGGWLDQYKSGGEKSTEQNPTRMSPVNVKGKMPKVDWYESFDPRNWGLRDYSAVDDFGTAFNRARQAGQNKFYWKGERFNTAQEGEDRSQALFSLSQEERNKIFNSVNPEGYPGTELFPAIKRYLNNSSFKDEEPDEFRGVVDDDAWAFYMGVPQEENSITRSNYKPSNSKDKVKNYYTIRNAYPDFEKLVLEDANKMFTRKGREDKFTDSRLGPSKEDVYGVLSKDSSKVTGRTSFYPLENATYSKGQDEKGKYISVYDIYDFDVPYQEKIGLPYEIYDRIYYKEGIDGKLIPKNQDGAKLSKYQIGGEKSTEQNPTRMAPVDISVQRPSWFERNIERPLERWGSSYAQRISDATGGSEWYKQPNSVASAFFSTGPGFALEAPQLTGTYAATGKVQTPSEAMDIQNPYGAFAVDALLDPATALTAGSRTLKGIGNFALGKLEAPITKQINKNPKLALSLQNRRPIQSIDNVTISPGLQQGDVKSIYNPSYLLGKSKPGGISEMNFFKGLNKGTKSLDDSLRKRVEDLSSTEGFNRLVNQEREWLLQQGQDPSVAERVARLNARARIEELKNTTNINKDAFQYTKENFLTGNNEFVKNKSLYDNAYFSPDYNLNWGESIDDKIKYLMSKTEKPNYSKPQPGGIAIGYNFVNNKPVEMHEIAHALQRGSKKERVLPIDNELRQITPKKQLGPADQVRYNYFNTGSQGQEPSAFANELRESMFQKGFIPDYYSPITETQVQDAYKYFKKNPIGVYDPKDGTFLSNTRIFDFMEPNKTNSKILTDVLNKLPAVAPIAAGVGASQLQEKKYGGWLNKYQDGGELPELNSKLDVANFYKNPLSEKYGISQNPESGAFEYYLKSAEKNEPVIKENKKQAIKQEVEDLESQNLNKRYVPSLSDDISRMSDIILPEVKQSQARSKNIRDAYELQLQKDLIDSQLYNESLFPVLDPTQLPVPFIPKPVVIKPKAKSKTPVFAKKQPVDKRQLPYTGVYVDRGTNTGWVATANGVYQFPVLTGRSKDAKKTKHVSATLQTKRVDPTTAVTPLGYFVMDKVSANPLKYDNNVRGLRGIPAFGEPRNPAGDKKVTAAIHQTYNPAVRGPLYNQNSEKRRASAGCINCRRPDYEYLERNISPQDTIFIFDSRNSRDKKFLQAINKKKKARRKNGGQTNWLENYI